MTVTDTEKKPVMPGRVPTAVETRHAKLLCEGTCGTVVEHAYHSTTHGMDGTGGPCDYFKFACKACGTLRVWGTQAGSNRIGRA